VQPANVGCPAFDGTSVCCVTFSKEITKKLKRRGLRVLLFNRRDLHFTVRRMNDKIRVDFISLGLLIRLISFVAHKIDDKIKAGAIIFRRIM
jgi:hypothetical protein